MVRTPAPVVPYDHVRAYYAERLTASRHKFRAAVAETLTDWRLGCIPPRPNWNLGRELFKSGVGEIAELRLRIAYMPLLQALERIQARVRILETVYSREDPYAPPPPS